MFVRKIVGEGLPAALTHPSLLRIPFEYIIILPYGNFKGRHTYEIAEHRPDSRYAVEAASWQVQTVEFMVGDRIYSCEMTSEEGEKLAYANLTSDVSYQMIQNIATCNNVKAKITYTNGSTQELNVGTQLRGICKDIVDLDLWYYYPNRYVHNTDNTKVR